MYLPSNPAIDYKVYCYTVCWRDCYSRIYNWNHKDFPTKKEAQQYARQMKDKKIKTKPYIIQTIKCRYHFKDNVEVEPVYNRKIIYWSYEKKIRY